MLFLPLTFHETMDRHPCLIPFVKKKIQINVRMRFFLYFLPIRKYPRRRIDGYVVIKYPGPGVDS